MAVDDVSLNASKPEGSPEGVDLRSARNSVEIETPPSGSRASSLLTDITECSSGSSSSSSASTTPRLPYQQQQSPLRGKPLYKSTSSFHLSCGRAHVPSNGFQACCQLARFPHHPYHPYNHNTLAASRYLRQMQPPHHCSQSAAFKIGHPPFGGVGGQIGCGHQFAPAPTQQTMVQQQHLRHQNSTASLSLSSQSQFGNPPRSPSPLAVGGCPCCPFCCQCDQRLCRKQSQTSNFYGSYEGLMGSVAHPMEPIPQQGQGPLPLTAEGLSWRRLHMSRAKLKATATTSELLSGFAMVAMVELQINEPTNVPEWLFVLFAVCTTVLVSVHIFALMISTYILPNVDAVSKMQHSHSGNEGNTHLSHHRNASHSSSISFSSGGDPTVLESPHERMRGFIELAWAFSTVLGLFLFLVELGILCWVKFWDHSYTAAWAATFIVIPVLILFVVFAAHFYRSLVAIKCDTSASDMRDLEKMKADLDAASRDAAAASNV